MISNYLRVAYRNLTKRKVLTVINILGLAVGLACCILIAMYVSYEVSYDQFHENEDKIYRVVQTTKTSAKTEEGATTPFPLGPRLKEEFSDRIEKSVRFFDMREETRTIRNKEANRSYLVDDFFVVDSTYFDVMNVNLVRGNPKTALRDPMSTVITTELAEKFFKNEDPIGQPLNFKGVTDFTVTGVIEPLPENSHLNIEMLLSFSSLEPLYGQSEFLENWFWNPCWTYIKLKEKAAPIELERQFAAFIDRNYTGREEGEEISLALQPITDIHLHSNLDQEISTNGSIFYVYLFSAVAVLVLLIACINFMNLSIARSTERVREVAMRKAVGAKRRQLFVQFMGESLLTTLLSVIASLIIVFNSLPWFNDLLGMNLSFSMIATGKAILLLISLWLIVGLLAGIYPALYLSGFNPAAIMQGHKKNASDGQLFRKSLVVFQFSLSVILIIGTVIVYMQIQHFQNKDLGFEKDQLVVMPIKQTLIAWEFDDFRNLTLSSAHIKKVTGTSKVLGSEEQTFYKFRLADQPDAPPTNMGLFVTHDFVNTYDIEILAGRTFSRDYPADADQSILINRSMLNQLKLDSPQEALGKTFYFTNSEDEREVYKVIGVVEDFNYTSVKKEISPLVISLVDEVRPIVSSISHATVRLSGKNIKDGLNDLENAWDEINHIDPFTYSFLDEKLEAIYKSETQMAKVSGIFSVICIIIACLGLFGLASFTASSRTNEIGIRKALGASISNIIRLLSMDYLKLVVLANIVAWPIIYYMAVQWLQNFPYRISLSNNLVLIFGSVGILSLIICMATVSYHSLQAAMVNPVDSIRRE